MCMNPLNMMLSALDSATVDTEPMLLPDYIKNLFRELTNLFSVGKYLGR